MTANIKINAEPESNARCKFTVDRPVYPDSSFYFGSSERAQGSPFAERIFQIPGVTGVLISHERVTVTKSDREDWPVIGRQIGAAIRAHLATGQPAVSDAVRAAIPPADEIRAKVAQVLEKEINPSVAAHGGHVSLMGVKGNTVYLKLGGGCQGCGQADVTLKSGDRNRHSLRGPRSRRHSGHNRPCRRSQPVLHALGEVGRVVLQLRQFVKVRCRCRW